MKTLAWLHISDIHSCPAHTGWDASLILDKLKADLNRFKDDGLVPDTGKMLCNSLIRKRRPFEIAEFLSHMGTPEEVKEFMEMRARAFVKTVIRKAPVVLRDKGIEVRRTQEYLVLLSNNITRYGIAKNSIVPPCLLFFYISRRIIILKKPPFRKVRSLPWQGLQIPAYHYAFCFIPVHAGNKRFYPLIETFPFIKLLSFSSS